MESLRKPLQNASYGSDPLDEISDECVVANALEKNST